MKRTVRKNEFPRPRAKDINKLPTIGELLQPGDTVQSFIGAEVRVCKRTGKKATQVQIWEKDSRYPSLKEKWVQVE